MKEHIEHLNESYRELLSSAFISYEVVKSFKNIMGVYIIYTIDNEILYIGSTNKFHVRFGVDLKHESTHTLIKKLIKAGVHSDRFIAVDHLKKHYKYRIQECSNKREAEALEHFAIWSLNPRHNHNYIAPL
jgi:hypothetical protein